MHWLSYSFFVPVFVIAATYAGEKETLMTTNSVRDSSNSKDQREKRSLSTHKRHSCLVTPFPIRFLHEDCEWFSIPGAPNADKSMAVSVDYHWKKGLIFYSWRDKIWRANISKASFGLKRATAIVTVGVDGPLSLAVDWEHDHLYWMSSRYQTVEVCDLEGRGRTLLVDNIRPIREYNNIVVDPYSGFFFFVSDYSVFRSKLDGTGTRRLPIESNERGDDAYGVRCIALDRKEKRVYLMGRLPSDGLFLDHVYYNGSDTRTVLPYENDYPWAVTTMDQLDGVVYFSNNSDTSYAIHPENNEITSRHNKMILSTVRVLHPNAQGSCSSLID